MPTFPPNPIDGMIIEPINGTFYRWSTKEGTWIKLDGYDNAIVLATPLQDGYMSSDDYNKVIGLLLPPPKTALSGQDCSFIFDKGIFGFQSSKGHLDITTELPLYQKDENGNSTQTTHVWQIHENTYGIYFNINALSLIDELEQRGHLRYNKMIGPQGKKGQRGEPGIDRLDTGPVGLKGVAGNNMPFNSNIISEIAGLVSENSTKGVVDINTEVISPTENYLIVTRANIGDIESCPRLIKPKNTKSPWVVAFDERPDTRKTIIECSTKQCGEDNCGFLGIGAQAFCASNLFYIDLTPIEEAVKARYEELLLSAKVRKEQVVNEWLMTLIAVFNEQKQAVCCAIENCESRRENDRHKERIEGLRVQAAASDNKLLIDGDSTRQYVDTDPGKDCPISTNIPSNRLCELECNASLSIDCKLNATTSNASSIDLPAGQYIIKYDGCCGYNGLIDSVVDKTIRGDLRSCDQLYGQPRNNQSYQPLTIGSDDVAAVYGSSKAIRIDFGISFSSNTLLKTVRIPALRVGSGQSLVASIYTVGSDGKPETKIQSVTIRYEAINQWLATYSMPSVSQFTEISFDFNSLELEAGNYFVSFYQEIIDSHIANNPYVIVALSSVAASTDNQLYISREDATDGQLNPILVNDYQPTLCITFDSFTVTPSAIITRDDYDAMYANPETIPSNLKKSFACMAPYSNSLVITYQGQTSPVQITTGDTRFRDNKSAQNNAMLKTYTIDHYGGTFSAYFTEGTPGNIEKENDGELKLCLAKVGTVGTPVAGDDNCIKPYLQIDLDCELNYSELTAILSDLPLDEYVAVITDCCCTELNTGYQGRISIKYMSSGGEQILSTPDYGVFNTADAAEKMYLGSSFCFIHEGGTIKIWAITQPSCSGAVTVSIYRKVCLEQQTPAVTDGSDATSPPEIEFPGFTHCDMNLDQVDFYECGWLAEGCCGVWLKAGGTQWIIIKRSIGDDASCGGGENENTECIAKGLLGGFHPAIAFPTGDGSYFLGKPTPGNYIRFTRDVDLEAQIMAQLRAGGPDIYKIVGDPLTNFEGIIFPSAGT